MTRNRPQILILAALTVLALACARQASASIILDLDVAAGPVSPNTPADQDNSGQTPSKKQLIDLTNGGLNTPLDSGGASNSQSQSSGSTSSGQIALISTAILPPPTIVSRLAGQASLTLANPPPEVLLPPPRWSRALRFG